MPKGIPNKRYTPEFKRMVVETMKKEHLSIYAAVSYTHLASDDLPGESGGSHSGGRSRFQGISVAGVGGGYDHLPQRRVFHEVFKGDSETAGGGSERCV